MNRKFVPLLGIAFVVAVICTGIFYGLFAGKLRTIAETDAGSPVVLASRNLEPGTVIKDTDLRVTSWSGTPPKGAFPAAAGAVGSTVLLPIAENEPLTATRVVAGGNGGAGLAVPSGMRAVSVHVADSAGVLELASPGQRVDIQVFVPSQDGVGQLRTILEDAALLSKSAADAPTKPPIVTVLVTPRQADMLALADTSARLRMTLRNPLDKERAAAGNVTLASLLRTGAVKAEPRLAMTQVRNEAKAMPTGAGRLVRRVQFRVRLLEGVRRLPEGMSQWLAAPPAADLMQVAALRPEFNAETELRGLKEHKGVSVVASSSVSAANNREVSVQATDSATAVRLRFVPAILASNRFTLRVQPEVVASGWSRKIDTEVELLDGQSFVVTGLTPAGTDSRPLLVLVTSQMEKPVDTASLQREP